MSSKFWIQIRITICEAFILNHGKKCLVKENIREKLAQTIQFILYAENRLIMQCSCWSKGIVKNKQKVEQNI